MEIENINVFLIEDNPGDALLIEEFLKEDASRVYHVSWVDRLDKIDSELLNTPFDIVLTDLSLPDSFGIDTFFSVKNQFANSPIIILTGTKDKELTEKAIQNGADDYIEKNNLTSKNLVTAIQYAIDRRKYYDSLRTLTSKLKEQNEDLEAYNHTVAHDLRGHLEVMSGYANLLFHDTEQLSTDEIKDYAKYIYITSNTLTKVIRELLLFASMDKLDINRSELKMKDIVDSVISGMFHLIEKHKAEIKLPDEWLDSEGYAPLIEEVWKNYISNAIKYGGEPPKIEIGCEYIDSNSNQDEIRYWIKDNGNGISKKDQDLVFKKFHRMDKAKATGYGLGLSIVRRIMKKLGGTSGVESVLGMGSTFYFTLPAKNEIKIDKVIEVDDSEKTNAPGKAESEKTDQTEKTILVVEDTDISFKYLESVLAKEDIKILWAKNGEEAVESCRNNMEIDLVMMDIKMPIMNGYDATKKIKKTRPNLPIIAQTAYALMGDREKALEIGCDDYIAKPLKKKELIKKITKYLNV